MYLTDSQVSSAIRNALGLHHRVIKWRLEEMMKPGDNFATNVMRLHVQLETEEFSTISNETVNDSLSVENELHSDSTKEESMNSSWTGIVKMNSKKDSTFFKTFSKFIFKTETEFYTTILPNLMGIFNKPEQMLVRMPKYYFSSMLNNEEVIILDDLRCEGYKMANKSDGLTFVQCKLAVEGLGKLHAASRLLRNKLTESLRNVDTNSMIDSEHMDHVDFVTYLSNNSSMQSKLLNLISGDNYLVTNNSIFQLFTELVSNRITRALAFLENIPRQEAATTWLRNILANVPRFLKLMLCDANSEFTVLCHGDTWTNNFMFRYIYICHTILVYIFDDI